MAHILLVEDEPWFGELYAQLLGHEHDVRWCLNGYQAIDAVDDGFRPDVIVLDVLLPWANGVQLLHELASYGDTAAIPIVLFSAALPDKMDAEVMRSYSVVAVLDKTTVKPAKVIKTINGVIKVHADH